MAAARGRDEALLPDDALAAAPEQQRRAREPRQRLRHALPGDRGRAAPGHVLLGLQPDGRAHGRGELPRPRARLPKPRRRRRLQRRRGVAVRDERGGRRRRGGRGALLPEVVQRRPPGFGDPVVGAGGRYLRCPGREDSGRGRGPAPLPGRGRRGAPVLFNGAALGAASLRRRLRRLRSPCPGTSRRAPCASCPGTPPWRRRRCGSRATSRPRASPPRPPR